MMEHGSTLQPEGPERRADGPVDTAPPLFTDVNDLGVVASAQLFEPASQRVGDGAPARELGLDIVPLDLLDGGVQTRAATP